MKKYKVKSVAEALGVSQSSITAFASSQGFSTKGGIDMERIIQIARRHRRVREPSDPEEVTEIRHILNEIGMEGYDDADQG